MNFKCPKCKKGIVQEENPGIDWDVIGNDCIARSDMVCANCNTRFNIHFNLDRVENAADDIEVWNKIEELDSA